MKIARIDAQFPELKGDCYVSSRGEASTPRAAISRAMATMFKNDKLRRKRITTFKATITITTKTEESAATNA